MFVALNHSFIQSLMTCSYWWRHDCYRWPFLIFFWPLSRYNTHTHTRTYRICGHAGEERRLFIEAWQDKFKQGEAEVNVERCEPQLVTDPILKTENAALSTNLNISTCHIKNARSPERVLIPLNPAFYEQIYLRYLVFIWFLRCLTKLRHCPTVHWTFPPDSRHQSRQSE